MTITALEIEEILLKGAEGDHAAETAVRLLANHNAWFYRIDLIPFLSFAHEGPLSACIRYEDMIAAIQSGDISCSKGEEAILRLAGGIAAGLDISPKLLEELGTENRELVVASIAEALEVEIKIEPSTMRKVTADELKIERNRILKDVGMTLEEFRERRE